MENSRRKVLLAEMVDGNIPIEIVKQTTRVIVTSENAGRLQEYVTILDKPADIRGTAIRL